MRNVLKTSTSATKFADVIVDIIKKEYREHQTEIILEQMYLQKKEEKNERQQCSYWNITYSSIGAEENDGEENEFIQIGHHWVKVIFFFIVCNTFSNNSLQVLFGVSSLIVIYNYCLE